MNVAGKVIGLGVCGGIAAYKVVELARDLTQAGADVRVVMTPSATEFVGPITFSTLTGNPVRTELFPEPAPAEIPHTDLARKADLIVIAPATAKVIAKFAAGISDDLMSALLLSANCPIVMAPAMHTEMWENEATRQSVEVLRGRGVRFVGPDVGPLAGPDVGPGRLSEIPAILAAIEEELEQRISLDGRHVLITAGPTREPIDAVRYIGNRSSGKMGYALAHEALRRGAKVTLVSGPSSLTAPSGADLIRVETAEQMNEAVLSVADTAEIIILAAAVADWRPKSPEPRKLKKAGGALEVEFEATPDIAALLGSQRKKGRVLVGFAAETEDLEVNSREKLASKSLDMIVANLVGVADSGFEVETNRAIIMDAEGTIDVGLTTKRELSRRILDRIVERYL